MPAFRCSICGFNWPVDREFQKCASCGEKCDAVGNIDSMPDDEAWSLKNNYDFDRFYEEWDRTRDPKRLEPDHEAA